MPALLNMLALLAGLVGLAQPVDLRFSTEQVTPGKDSYTITVPALAGGAIDLLYRVNGEAPRESLRFCRLDARGQAVVRVGSGIRAGIVEVVGVRRSGTAPWLPAQARMRILPVSPEPAPPPQGEPLLGILWRDLKLLGAAALALLSILSAGRWLLARLGRPFDHRTEAAIFAWSLGCLAVGTASFALALCGLIYRGVFFALALLALLAGWGRHRWHRPSACAGSSASAHRLKACATPIEWACWLLGGFYAAIYFVAALAPEVSPDAVHYHLGLVHLYQVNHRMTFYPETFYSALPQGMEMVYLFCSMLGGYSVARLAHLGCLVALAAAIQALGRRLGYPQGGAIAAVAVFSASLFGTNGTTGYVDVAVTLGIFLAFYAAFLWRESEKWSHLWLAGLSAGWAMSVKPTGAVAVPIVLILLLWPKAHGAPVSRPAFLRDGSPLLITKRAGLETGAPYSGSHWRAAVLVCFLAAMVFAPWPVRNWIVFQNPLMPLGNRWFPNPHLLPTSEADYLRGLRHWAGFGEQWRDYWSWPLEVTLRGTRLQGFFGPFFLLAPLALAAVKKREGRWLLAAGVLAATPLAENILTRFLMPAVPFLAIATVIGTYVLVPARAANAVLALALAVHSVFNWPWVVARRSEVQAVALSEVPFRAAFRLESEHDYLARRLDYFGAIQYLQQQTPVHARVLSFEPFQQAYTSRFLLLYYVSEFSRKAVDAIYEAAEDGRCPCAQIQARFPPVKARALLLKQNQSAPYSYWTIYELDVLDAGGRPLSRAGLRYSSNVNPFEAGLAADGNQLTAWTTAYRLEAGTWFRVDLGADREVREIRYTVPPNDTYLLPEVRASSDLVHWTPLEASWDSVKLPPHNWRPEAAALLNSWGLHYLLFANDPNSPFSGALRDLLNRREEWGVREVFRSDDAIVLQLRLRQ